MDKKILLLLRIINFILNKITDGNKINVSIELFMDILTYTCIHNNLHRQKMFLIQIYKIKIYISNTQNRHQLMRCLLLEKLQGELKILFLFNINIDEIRCSKSCKIFIREINQIDHYYPFHTLIHLIKRWELKIERIPKF